EGRAGRVLLEIVVHENLLAVHREGKHESERRDKTSGNSQDIFVEDHFYSGFGDQDRFSVAALTRSAAPEKIVARSGNIGEGVILHVAIPEKEIGSAVVTHQPIQIQVMVGSAVVEG